MLAVLFPQPGEFVLSEMPKPEIRAGHVLVQVRSTTICATDLKIFKGDVPFVTYPHIPGHEFGGEIVQVGGGVTSLQPGDKVGVEVHVGCGICPRCAEGLYNLCTNYGKAETGHAHIGFTVPGGLAEYCAVPARAAHRLPEGLDYDQGAFTDTVGIALWAFERAGGVRAGEKVVIIGPGALGLIAVQIAHFSGAAQVIAVGVYGDEKRLALARDFGADEDVIVDEGTDPIKAVHDLTGGLGADLVIEFAGNADAARQALELARRGGRVILAGATSPGPRLDVDLSVIVRGHLSVFGSVANPKSVSRRANMLMQKGLVDVMPLITHQFSLNDFSKAWEMFLERDGDPIRIMMYP